MNLRLIFCLIILILGFQSNISGQKLKSVRNNESQSLELRDCSTRSPGTVSFGPVVGQSNDGRPDTIYLCYQDQVFIKNNGDGDFNTGDPVPATPSAVGYILYGCQPTVGGTTFADIQGDCVLTNPPPPPGELWYFMGTPNGNITLYNDGSVNATHNAGSPFTLWLAPATFDAYTVSGGEYYGQYEGGGSCVKVNTAAAFPVVYLNEIKVNSLVTLSPTSLSGSFTVTGGFPELESAATYNITMTKKGAPATVANLFGGPFRHGSTVNFAVPSAGIYIVTISDGKSCSVTREVEMPQGSLDLIIESGMVEMNDEICLDITVADFNDLVGGSFAIGFNPYELQFTNISFPPGNPLGLNMGHFGTGDAGNGIIRFFWVNNPLIDMSLPDNTVIMSVCFKAIGTPGTKSPVRLIANGATALEFSNINGTKFNINVTEGIVMITDPNDLQVYLNVCSTTGNTGSVTFTAYGPDAQYNYVFNNGVPNFTNAGTPVTFNNLAPGNYVLDVFSVTGVHVIENIVIQNAPPINLTPAITAPKCVDSPDGAINIAIAGGVQPYAVEWSTFEFNINTINELSNGVYSVTVTDNVGCIYSESFTLFTPPIGLNPPVIVSPACSGQLTGSITIAATGGTPKPGSTYDYHWSYNNITQTGVATGVLSGIPEGIYTVTVTDANGCRAVSSFELLPGVEINATFLKQNPTCFGDGTGAITVTGTTNGTTTGPYTFTWGANAGTPVNTATTSQVSGLNNGNYTVTIADNNGCSVKKDITIDGPGEIKFLIANKTDDNCGGQPSGSALIYDGSGNTVPWPDPNNPGNGLYKFTWSNGSNPTNVDAVSLHLTNLAGSADGIRYYVTITGADGCMADTSFLIFKKDAPLIEFDTLNPIACAGGNDGVIQANITVKGSEVSTVTWSNNAGLPVNGGDPKNVYTSTISNLNGGDYIVTVTTLSGCTISDTVTLEGQGSLALSNDIIVPSTCPDSDDGSITLVTSGGVPPYNYLWSNGQTTDVASGLSPGTYSVTVSDQSSCPSLIQSFVVGHEPTVASAVDPASVTASDCFEAATGSGGATISASGGNAASYTFTWSSGETNTGTSSTANQLKGGWQYVTITDGICSIVDSVFIPSPDAISANKAAAVISDVSCFGEADGAVSFTPTGGNGGYSFNWSPSAGNSSSISGLAAATYYVTITDSKNCIGIDSFRIVQPELLVAAANASLTQDVRCAGEETGSIAIDVSGGNGGNTFSWNPALAGNVSSAGNLPAGNYLIAVTDSKGCTAQVAVTLNEPAPLAVNFDPVPEPQCAGFETNFELNAITGGVGPDYTYTIDHGQSYTTFEIAKVTGGSHILTITDENGCTLDTSFTVSEPAPILVSLPEEIALNLGDSVLINPVVQSAFPISATSWSPAEWVSCISCDVTYATAINNQYITVLITDVNGCTGIDSVLLKVDRTRKVFIPNAFSPNKDGINDLFQVYTGPGVQSINYIRVFDRYGALVYEQLALAPNENGSDRGWDGSYRGKFCDPGVFTYVTEVRFIDGKEQLYFGSVTLVR